MSTLEVEADVSDVADFFTLSSVVSIFGLFLNKAATLSFLFLSLLSCLLLLMGSKRGEDCKIFPCALLILCTFRVFTNPSSKRTSYVSKENYLLVNYASAKAKLQKII